MPEILKRLLGLKFQMRYKDNDFHDRPHIHVEYGEHKASIAIDNIEVLAGYLPAKQLKNAEGRIHKHQEKLMEMWEKAVKGETITRIE